MDTGSNIIISVLKSKYFWIVIAALFLLWWFKKNWYKIETKLTPKDQTNPVDTTPDAQKEKLQKLGANIKIELDGAPRSHSQYADDVLSLSDNDLRYLDHYYRTFANPGVTLYKDIDDSLYGFGLYPSNGEMLDRLKSLGLDK